MLMAGPHCLSLCPQVLLTGGIQGPEGSMDTLLLSVPVSLGSPRAEGCVQSRTPVLAGLAARKHSTFLGCVGIPGFLHRAAASGSVLE